MHPKLRLTPPQLAFVISTRAMLAGGVGLLVAGKLAPRTRRAIGLGLAAVGAVATVPAVRTLRRAGAW
jgi:hypothetical protein